MKIAHLLGQYLLQTKQMQLKGIGEFILDNPYENPFENEKGKIRLPGNTIRFVANKKAPEDSGLINFIAQQTTKIKPLAAADLEDFLNIGKQLLNVSKQFYIEGLGTLILNDNNDYGFVQGNEVVISAELVEKNLSLKQPSVRGEHPEELSFGNEFPPRGNKSEQTLRKFLVIFAFLLGLSILGWVGYYFIQQWQNGKNEPTNPLETIQPVIPPTVLPDSAAGRMDSSTVTLPAPTGPVSYKVIIETSKHDRAIRRHAELLKMGYSVNIRTKDSVTYDLYTEVTGPLSDSSRTRDSITRFFGRKARIELQ